MSEDSDMRSKMIDKLIAIITELNFDYNGSTCIGTYDEEVRTDNINCDICTCDDCWWEYVEKKVLEDEEEKENRR